MTRFWMKRKQQKIEEKSSIHKGPLIKIWEITYRATNLWNKFLFLMLKKMKRKTKRFYQSSANANHCLNEQYFMDENSAMNKHCVCWFFFLQTMWILLYYRDTFTIIFAWIYASSKICRLKRNTLEYIEKYDFFLRSAQITCFI